MTRIDSRRHPYHFEPVTGWVRGLQFAEKATNLGLPIGRHVRARKRKSFAETDAADFSSIHPPVQNEP